MTTCQIFHLIIIWAVQRFNLKISCRLEFNQLFHAAYMGPKILVILARWEPRTFFHTRFSHHFPFISLFFEWFLFKFVQDLWYCMWLSCRCQFWIFKANKLYLLWFHAEKFQLHSKRRQNFSALHTQVNKKYVLQFFSLFGSWSYGATLKCAAKNYISGTAV
jgi:hypothetical protein